MSALDFLLPWDSQPQEVAELNAGIFPSAELAFNAGVGPVNLVSGAIGTVSGSPTYGVGIGGRSLNVAAASTGGIYWPVRSRSVADPWTVIVNIRIDGSTAATQGFLQIASTTANSGSPYLLLARNNTDFRVFAGGNYRVTDAAALIQGTEHVIAVTYDGATMTVVRNGVVVGTYSSANLGSNTSTHAWVGNGFNGSVGSGTYGAWYSSAAMSVAVLQEITRGNHWQLFAPQSIWVPVSAAAAPSGTFIPLVGRGPGMALAGPGGLAGNSYGASA